MNSCVWKMIGWLHICFISQASLKVASLIDPCVKAIKAFFSIPRELMWKQVIKTLCMALIIDHSIQCILRIITGYVSLRSDFCHTSWDWGKSVIERPSYKFIHKIWITLWEFCPLAYSSILQVFNLCVFLNFTLLKHGTIIN